MLFHVDIVPEFPHDWTQDHLTEMLAQETAAAIALMERGVLLRIDRVVGRGGNVSLWEAASPEALDEAIRSLPLAPYIKVSVTPLMKHRVTLAYEAQQKKAAAAGSGR